MQANDYTYLVTVKCSADLHFFLCSVYTPICLNNYDKPIPPCRSVCERSRDGCLPVLKSHGFKWPKALNCDQFPERSIEPQLCMEKNQLSSTTFASVTTPKKNVMKSFDYKTNESKKKKSDVKIYSHQKNNSSQNENCDCNCKKPLHRINNIHHPYYNKVFTGGIPNCAWPCLSPFVSPQIYALIPLCLGMATALVLALGLLNMITVLFNRDRLSRPPHRFVLYVSCCQMCLSVGVLIRLIAGHQRMVCYPSQNTESYSHSGGDIGQLSNHLSIHDSLLFMIRFQNSSPSLCSISFLFVYFFYLASILWWWILCLTWFFSDGLGWTSTMIDKYSQVYHFVCWTVPGLLSMLALTMSAVDGDPITGLCLVGNSSPAAHGPLVPLLLVPITICTASGIFFLVCGFSVAGRRPIPVLTQLPHTLSHSQHQQQQQYCLNQQPYTLHKLPQQKQRHHHQFIHTNQHQHSGRQQKIRAATLTSLSTMTTAAAATVPSTNNNTGHESTLPVLSSSLSSINKLKKRSSSCSQYPYPPASSFSNSPRYYYGYLGLVCAVPLCLTTGALIYEVRWRDQWETSFACDCSYFKSSSVFKKPLLNNSPIHPGAVLPLLKYSSFFLIGIICGPWIWPFGTVKSWMLPLVKAVTCGGSLFSSNQSSLYKDNRKSGGYYCNPQYPLSMTLNQPLPARPCSIIGNNQMDNTNTAVAPTNTIPSSGHRLQGHNTSMLTSGVLQQTSPLGNNSGTVAIDSDSYASYQTLSNFSNTGIMQPPSSTQPLIVNTSNCMNKPGSMQNNMLTDSTVACINISSNNNDNHHNTAFSFTNSSALNIRHKSSWPLL